MPKSHPPDYDADRLEDSPIAWFAEMVFAWERRDIDRAAEAKRQLASLGWHVRYCKPRPSREGGSR
jgi:hypothetical protein